MQLSGRVALITGGAKRVGRAIVLELARAGCDVAIHYRHSRPEAERLAEELSGMGRRSVLLSGDLANPATWPVVVQDTVEHLQHLDILVNNASVFLTGRGVTGLSRPDTVEGFSHEQWELILRTNLVAPMALCHHARPYLEARGAGKIVNLCDIAADRPYAQHIAYGASKAALAALTKALALALAPAIQVNGVAPGIAIFPDEYSEEERRKLTRKVPLGRAGTPEEVARLVRFLVETGDYITGQIIPIDGGRSLL
jgi:pteridine reductase